MTTPLEVFAQTNWYDIPITSFKFYFEKNMVELCFLYPQGTDYTQYTLTLSNILQFKSDAPDDVPLCVMGVYEASLTIIENKYAVNFTFQLGENCLPLWKVSFLAQDIFFSQNWQND